MGLRTRNSCLKIGSALAPAGVSLPGVPAGQAAGAAIQLAFHDSVAALRGGEKLPARSSSMNESAKRAAVGNSAIESWIVAASFCLCTLVRTSVLDSIVD